MTKNSVRKAPSPLSYPSTTATLLLLLLQSALYTPPPRQAGRQPPLNDASRLTEPIKAQRKGRGLPGCCSSSTTAGVLSLAVLLHRRLRAAHSLPLLSSFQSVISGSQSANICVFFRPNRVFFVRPLAHRKRHLTAIRREVSTFTPLLLLGRRRPRKVPTRDLALFWGSTFDLISVEVKVDFRPSWIVLVRPAS